MFDFWVEMSPNPRILTDDFTQWGLDIRSAKEPLKRSIQEVMAPSFKANFDEGGRPSWEPLSETTLLMKALAGQPSDILVATGQLKKTVQQLNLWKIDGPGGEAYIDTLPEKISYGKFHMEGTRRMPARPFMDFQEEDLDKIQEIFADWIVERAVRNGFVLSEGI